MGYELPSSFARLARVLISSFPFLVVGILGLFPCHSRVEAAPAPLIEQVVIEGNERVSSRVIQENLFLSKGQPYMPSSVSASLKALYGMGVFSDVRIAMEKGTVFVFVQESPVIYRIVFEGNEYVADDAIKLDSSLQAGQILRIHEVHREVERITELYAGKGYPSVSVEPQVINLPDNRVDLVFEIAEGRKAGISEIVFVGNSAFGDAELKAQLVTSETGLLSWLTLSDVYTPERIKANEELLRLFYLGNGYLDFRVISTVAELDEVRGTFILTITVSEGEQYHFGPIGVESRISGLEPEFFSGYIEPQEGGVADMRKVTSSSDEMVGVALRLGYPFVRVRFEEERDPEQAILALNYIFEEGPKLYVERIEIRGNERTEGYVIRRNVDFVEGDSYSPSRVARARHALQRTGLFESVHFLAEQGSAPDLRVLIIEVKEKPTGGVGLSGGYMTSDDIHSGVDGFTIDFSVFERNLLGRGQVVRLLLSGSESFHSFTASFVEPRFLGRDLSWGVDVFGLKRRKSDTMSFGKRRLGFKTFLGFSLSPHMTFKPRYKLERRDVFDVSETASITVKDREGVSLLSSVGYSLVYSTLNLGHPRNGFSASFSQDLAGLGGDVSFIRTVGNASVYHELSRGFVGVLSAKGGYIEGLFGSKIGVADAFFKGGDLVRGFAPSGLGPRDKVADDSIGGKWFAGGMAEMRFPLGNFSNISLRGAVFANVGVLSGTDYAGREGIVVLDSGDLRSSVGCSLLLWDTPLGDFRLDWAYVLQEDEYDKGRVFRFSAETGF